MTNTTKRDLRELMYMIFGMVVGSVITMEVIWIKLNGMGFVGQLVLAKLGLF